MDFHWDWQEDSADCSRNKTERAKLRKTEEA